jgi:sulfite exporter TauE/SafE
MIFAEMFLVGLGSSGGCLAHCGSTLLPIVLCEEKRRWNLASIFLITRLFTYIALAYAVRYAGKTSGFSVLLNSPYINGGIFLFLSLLLGRYGLSILKPSCSCDHSKIHSSAKARFALFKSSGTKYATKAGFLSATGLCPPMFAFIASSISSQSYFHLLFAITGFFLGTSTILLPLIGFGSLLKGIQVQKIGMLFCFIASAMYLIQGTGLILRGVFHA